LVKRYGSASREETTRTTKKNKDPLGAEEVDAEVIPPAVIATPASETESELQQKLEVTTEQFAQSHAKQVQMEAQIRELQAQMAEMQMNNTLLEVAEKSITNQQQQKRYQQAKIIAENETIQREDERCAEQA
jgi:outer membrane translocation and assembly module TamA